MTTMVDVAKQMASEAREILKPRPCEHRAFVSHYTQNQGSDVETRYGQCHHCQAWVVEETWLVSQAVTMRLMTEREMNWLARHEDNYRLAEQFGDEDYHQ
jgi:hypothetical protein